MISSCLFETKYKYRLENVKYFKDRRLFFISYKTFTTNSDIDTVPSLISNHPFFLDTVCPYYTPYIAYILHCSSSYKWKVYNICTDNWHGTMAGAALSPLSLPDQLLYKSTLTAAGRSAGPHDGECMDRHSTGDRELRIECTELIILFSEESSSQYHEQVPASSRT